MSSLLSSHAYNYGDEREAYQPKRVEYDKIDYDASTHAGFTDYFRDNYDALHYDGTHNKSYNGLFIPDCSHLPQDGVPLPYSNHSYEYMTTADEISDVTRGPETEVTALYGWPPYRDTAETLEELYGDKKPETKKVNDEGDDSDSGTSIENPWAEPTEPVRHRMGVRYFDPAVKFPGIEVW